MTRCSFFWNLYEVVSYDRNNTVSFPMTCIKLLSDLVFRRHGAHSWKLIAMKSLSLVIQPEHYGVELIGCFELMPSFCPKGCADKATFFRAKLPFR